MVKTLVLPRLASAGMSFTQAKIDDYIKMYEVLCKSKAAGKYADFQSFIFSECNITESNVRMYTPFFAFHGLVNKFTSVMNYSDYFTPEGEIFAKAIIIERKASSIGNVALVGLAQDIQQKALQKGFLHRAKTEGRDYYFAFLRFCQEYSTINLDEFNYVVYAMSAMSIKEKSLVSSIKSEINNYRTGATSFNFVQDIKNKSSGKTTRQSFPNNTFSYTRNLLEQAGLIYEIQTGKFAIKSNMKDFVEELLKE